MKAFKIIGYDSLQSHAIVGFKPKKKFERYSVQYKVVREEGPKKFKLI